MGYVVGRKVDGSLVEVTKVDAVELLVVGCIEDPAELEKLVVVEYVVGLVG
jgi:hypothetical protein